MRTSVFIARERCARLLRGMLLPLCALIALCAATGAVAQTAPYIAPTNISFGSQPANTVSNFWTVTFNNTSGSTIHITSISVTSANFQQTNNCPVILPAYSNCNIQVSFSPSGAGPFSGALVFTDNGGGSPQVVNLSGTGVFSGPAVVVSPTNIDFGSVEQGTTANAWTVTLSNTSGSPATINNISVSDPTDFAETNNCGTLLPAYSTCTAQVVFTPSSTGPYTATLNFQDNAPPSPQSVTLTGTGLSNAPSLFFAPSDVDFGNQTVGTTSNSWTVTLNNTSSTNATFTTPITLTGPFTETDNCGSGLAAHSTCNIVVTFLPTVTGTATGLLSVSINGGNIVTPVHLTGVGTTQVPVLVFAPTSVDFGNQVVGTTSNSWTITLNNTSGTPATLISSLFVTGPFTETDNCGTFLPAYSTCNVVVAFAPSTTGPAAGQLTALLNGANAPLTVSLTGTGTAATPVLVFSPTSINFGSQPVGVAGNGWTVTLNNTSDFPATFTNPIAITGSSDFTETDNCGTFLAAHSTCNVVVIFTPSSATVINGDISLLMNGASAPLTVSLTGTGTTSTPVVVFSPTSIDFGGQTVGVPSNGWTVTLNNESGTTATLTGPITITGSNAFTETDNCGTTLPAYSTCNVVVVFTPGSTGPLHGQLIAIVSGSSTPLTVTLTGTGTSATPVVTFSPTSINFGGVGSGSSSNPWTVTLNNESGTPVTFASPLSFSGNPVFTETDDCGSFLPAYSTCTLQITFAPPVPGTFFGQLVLLVNGVSTPLTVSLTGTGTGNSLQFAPSSINFGSVNVGNNTSWTATLNNTTNTGMTLATPPEILGSTAYTQTNTCGTFLPAFSTCNIVITFTPPTTGIIPGILVVEAGNSAPLVLPLTGTGILPPALSFSQGSIAFGNQAVGTSSSVTITLNNTGGTAASLAIPVEAIGASYSETNNCGTFLPAFSTCNVVVTFTPVGPVTFPGDLIVEAAGFAPQIVLLSGKGVPITSAVFYAPPGIDFGEQLENTAGNAWTVTLNNTSGAVIPFSGVSLTDTADFTQTNNCGTVLPAFSTCTIQVAFTPSTSGLIHGALTSVIEGVTETVPLQGTGTVPPDYTISVHPSHVTLNAGQTALATFTFTPVGGYVGTVNFYCTNLTLGVSCIFNPPSVTADGSNTVQTAQLTIMTTGPYSGTVAANHVDNAPVLAALYLLPAALLCGLIGLRRRKLRGPIKQWMLLVLVLGLIGGMVGCSGFNNFTPAGQSVVTVNSAAGASGGTVNVHSANFTLTITQ